MLVDFKKDFNTSSGFMNIQVIEDKYVRTTRDATLLELEMYFKCAFRLDNLRT